MLTLTLKTQSTVLFLTANNLHSGRLRKQRRFSLLIKGKAVRPFARTNEKSPEISLNSPGVNLRVVCVTYGYDIQSESTE